MMHGPLYMRFTKEEISYRIWKVESEDAEN